MCHYVAITFCQSCSYLPAPEHMLLFGCYHSVTQDAYEANDLASYQMKMNSVSSLMLVNSPLHAHYIITAQSPRKHHMIVEAVFFTG